MIQYHSLTKLAAYAIALIGFTACDPKIVTYTTPVPEPPQPILQPYPQSDHASIQPIIGSYKASYFDDSVRQPVNYPINNQTVTVTVQPVASDTVGVTIQAMANGNYSPGRNLIYTKAVVVTNTHTDGTVLYSVYLAQPTTGSCGFDALMIYSNHDMDYKFIPTGNAPCTGGVRIRLAKQ